MARLAVLVRPALVRYPVAEYVTRITAPIVVVYGSEDSIVPPEQSQEVAGRVAGTVELVEVAGADHNDWELATGPELVAAVTLLADLVSTAG